MTTNNIPNRLAHEKSPYLLQHQYNPVDWFPWGEEAFVKAIAENKPIFLSIGYSTCHWCHVMEKESFEDQEVADLLNENYISIKVDREERPDIDHLYMTVCQAMTGQGGWPLTIVMTPEKLPFFAGTYYPKNRKYKRMGLMQLLAQIDTRWVEDREGLMEKGNKIAEEVERRSLSNLKGEVSESTLEKAYENYRQVFDSTYGGFGSSPKFPTSHNLSFLLRYHHQIGDDEALQIVEKSLESMHRGGIYDHIGYGFSRYSVDEKWLVPHFEKMLYDNALLAWTYLETYQVTGKVQYADVAEQIFTYVLRDMTDPEGGFYSAEDADSEGHEGKFYVWKPDEIADVLGAEEGALYCDVFDITASGNFEGHNIANLIHRDIATFAQEHDIPVAQLQARLEDSRQKLFHYREKRIHPGKDDKILTSWNGLMIMALAKGYVVLKKRAYLDAATQAVDFILVQLQRSDGRLLARYRDGEAAIAAFLDDYAFLTWGLLELYEASFDTRFLRKAIELNNQMIDLFWDDTNGGFYFYGSDSEQLFIRNKEIYDGALPSGNSVALMNLVKLSRLTNDERLTKLVDEQIKAFSGAVEQYPIGHALFLIGLCMAYATSNEIVIVGDRSDETMGKMIDIVHAQFRPDTLIISLEDGHQGDEARELMPLTKDKRSIDSKPTAYLCEDFSCKAPITDLNELLNT
jgi:uncharacterized protein YyaL (SSP411 family)